MTDSSKREGTILEALKYLSIKLIGANHIKRRRIEKLYLPRRKGAKPFRGLYFVLGSLYLVPLTKYKALSTKRQESIQLQRRLSESFAQPVDRIHDTRLAQQFLFQPVPAWKIEQHYTE